MKKLFILILTISFFGSCGSSEEDKLRSDTCACVKDAKEMQEDGMTQLMYIQSKQGKKCMKIVTNARKAGIDPAECE